MKSRNNLIVTAIIVAVIAIGIIAVVSFFKGLDTRSADEPFYAKVYDTILVLSQHQPEMSKSSAQVALDLTLRDLKENLFRKHLMGFDCRIDGWDSTNTTFWIAYAGEDATFGTKDDSSNRWTLAAFGQRHGFSHTNLPPIFPVDVNTAK